MVRKASLGLLFLGALFVAGCTGGSFTSTTQTKAQSSTITSVNVSCLPASVQAGQTSQCSVAVSGTGGYSSAVSWSVISGTISTSGIYTAPSNAPASGLDTRSEEHTSELQSP